MPPTQLTWQPGFSLIRKPTKRTAVRRKQKFVAHGDWLQQFEFIVEQPGESPGAESCRSEISRGSSTNHQTPAAQLKSPQTTTDKLVLGAHDTDRIGISLPSFDDVAGPSSTGTVQDGKNASIGTELTLWSTESALEEYSTEYFVHSPGPDSADVLQKRAGELFDTHRVQRSTIIAPSILYHSLWDRFKPVLDRYNQEFCQIPLTTNLLMNPFRYRADLHTEPDFLVHAVMALAGHHVESGTSKSHQQTSLQLLREGIDSYTNATKSQAMLDTIIILFSLDETHSNMGNWSTHLVGAYSLLEARGGIAAWSTSPRTEVQVGILIWWDAILSLLSREPPIFPAAYSSAILTSTTAQWDYFSLCGCPAVLVAIVMALTHLSAEKQKSASMRYVTFDTTVVRQLEHALESWIHVPSLTALDNEECMHRDTDKMHCSEAWRHALLLYVYRVFHWQADDIVPVSIAYRARVILDHVFACGDENLVGKQALLPLFLAGCELRDRSSRRMITQFCARCDERTRYHMFGSTLPLLEAVWNEQEVKGFENTWWGSVVDAWHTADHDSLLTRRICFG